MTNQMITGAALVLVGMLIGYVLHRFDKPVGNKIERIQSKINKVLNLNQAKIVDLQEIDLGDDN